MGKILTILGIIIASAFAIFPLAVFTAWVFGGMYVPYDLEIRAISSLLFSLVVLPTSIALYLEFS